MDVLREISKSGIRIHVFVLIYAVTQILFSYNLFYLVLFLCINAIDINKIYGFLKACDYTIYYKNMQYIINWVVDDMIEKHGFVLAKIRTNRLIVVLTEFETGDINSLEFIKKFYNVYIANLMVFTEEEIALMRTYRDLD